MDRRKALKLHDADEVRVRDGKRWVKARVCGDPRVGEPDATGGFTIVPVLLPGDGLRYVTNKEIR